MSAATVPRLSVVIPTHRRRGYVVDTVDSLRGQTLPTSAFEVVVVCDGDFDGTEEALGKLTTPFPLKVLVQAQSGPAAARNRGVAESTADIVVFLDDDILAAPELLAEHLEAQSGNRARVVVGRLLPDPTLRAKGWTLWEQHYFDRRYAVIGPGMGIVDGRKFYSGNASVARAAFEAVGGFNTAYQRAEDIELGYRLQSWGADLVFNGRAACVHRGVHSFDGWCRIQYIYGRCDVLMADIHGGAQPIPFARWFGSRNMLNRAFCRLGVDRPRLSRVLLAGWRAVAAVADGVRAIPVSRWSYSAIANLHYWQGVADELGGRDQLWKVVRAPLQGRTVTE
ncbi:MAG TPA: glycosyltransferase [Candidatus Dormibacteraeota bacterium]|nr:glycosyltransferase [Candidatus Dormibacteraeota bacterium]